MIQRFSSLVLASLLVLPPPLPAQPSAAAAQNDETFYDTVEVNVVNVEVFVTDRGGQRVTGLTQNDFEVFEDGKPVEITNFFASEGGRAAATVPGSAAPAATEIPEEQRLLLAIFVDNSNLSARARNSVLPKINEFLTTRLRPEDRVILSSYDGPGSLEVRTLPTSDPKAVVAALDQVAKVSAGRISGGAEVRRMVGQMEQSLRIDGIGSTGKRDLDLDIAEAQDTLDQIRIYAQEERNKAQAFIGALEQFVDGLSGVPGRKAVLLLSGGVPLRPAQAIYEAWENRFGRLNQEQGLGGSPLEAADVDLTAEVQKIGARANANRITFYAIGVTDTLSVGSAASGINNIWTRGQESSQVSTMGQSLYAIVAPTGGAAIIDAVNPGAVLAEMREDMDSFYSLGYTPSHRRSGKNHKVDVRVKRPGLKVRHRESYRERTSAEVMSDKVLAALMFGSRENPLEIGVQFGEEEPTKGGNAVQVTVKLPMSKLVLLPQGQFHEGRVTIFMAARDTQGRNSPVTEIKLPIRVPNEQLLTSLGQLAGYRTKLALRPVEHTVAVGVRDELGNIVSTVTASYTPGSTAEGPAGTPAAAPEPSSPTEGRGDHDE